MLRMRKWTRLTYALGDSSMRYDIQTTSKEELFIDCYLEAIDFTDTGDTDQPAHGAELDETFAREQVIDCLSFYQRIACYLSNDETGDAARDFWFTRNGHGVGFWDGDWPKYGEMFDRIAKGYGEVYALFDGGES